MIDQIRSSLYDLMNKEVKFIVKEGRNKKNIYYGILCNLYNRVILFKVNDIKLSYTYNDIINGTLKIIM